jgi:RNA polymerase sigma-70 factor (ECF subfamily)
MVAHPWPWPITASANGERRTRWRHTLNRVVRWLTLATEERDAQDPGRTRPQLGVAGTPAFDAFFQRHERDIFGYLWRMTGDEQAAYDLSQEVFLRAWQHFARVSAYERPGGWLFRVATNLALNHLRQRATYLAVARPLAEGADLGATDPALRLVEGDAVHRALMALAPRQRAALVLREVYGLTCDEIGASLGISRGAAKTMLWRARDEFRKHYEREGGR